MPATFTRTVRSLSADGVRFGNLWIGVALLLILAWSGWFFFSRVAVYEVADRARLEVSGQPRPVLSVLDAQVVRTHLRLGKRVEAGEVLMQLDDQLQQAALDVARQRLAALRNNLAAATSELEAEKTAAAAEIAAADSSYDEIRARIEEAQAHSDYAQQYLERIRQLHKVKAESDEAYNKAKSEAAARQAAWRAWQLALTRRQQEQRLKESERQSKVQELARERTEVAGQLKTQTAVVEQLKREVQLRKVRAPIAGRLGQVSDFPAGSFVVAGQPLAFILPVSEPRAVAYYAHTALGRIRPGQAARLRLDGFPWTQYGSLPATVTQVASESEAGLLRVQL